MTGNELYEPLRGAATRHRRGRWRWLSAAPLCLGAVGLAGSVGVILKDGEPRGGEPDIVGTIERPQPVVATAVTLPIAVATAAATGQGPKLSFVDPPAEPPRSDIPGQSVEVQNGVRVYRPIFAAGLAPNATVIKVPHGPAAVPDAESERTNPDARLSEPGPYGPLPRIADDGTRPADAYAVPSRPAATDDGRPRIALLVGGLGFDHAAVAQAAALPGVVTLGFAPYGRDLVADVGEARAAGHEVILQLPMEGSGKVDPPAHMLTADGAKNVEDLDWLLSRFPAYPGVSSLLGSKLLASESGLRPVLRALSARGLYFLEDGTSAHSLVDPMARELGLEATRADVVIDARSDPATIADDLARLESLARSRGIAIGTAIARPQTMQAFARFAAALEARGIVLVPLSQAIRARRPVAAAGLVRQP